jgi:hypothetical protein
MPRPSGREESMVVVSDKANGNPHLGAGSHARPGEGGVHERRGRACPGRRLAATQHGYATPHPPTGRHGSLPLHQRLEFMSHPLSGAMTCLAHGVGSGGGPDVGVVRERPGGCPGPQLQPKSNRRNVPATTNIAPARWRQPPAARNHRALPEAPLHQS